MSNFEKKLEEATEEELRFWINERDFRVVSLASDELTRRNLKKTSSEIQNLNKTIKESNRVTEGFTIVLILLTVMQLVFAIFQYTFAIYGSKNNFQGVVFTTLVFGTIFFSYGNMYS